MRILRPILLLIAVGLLLVSVDQFMNGYGDWQHAQLAEEAYRAEIRELEAERDRLQKRVEMLKTTNSQRSGSRENGSVI